MIFFQALWQLSLFLHPYAWSLLSWKVLKNWRTSNTVPCAEHQQGVHSFISWSTVSSSCCLLLAQWPETDWSGGEGACIQQTNWEMRQQGRQNRDNLKWLCLAAFVKSTKTETQFQEPLQEPSLQLTWSICVKPSRATLDVSPHERVHGVCWFIGLSWWLSW